MVDYVADDYLTPTRSRYWSRCRTPVSAERRAATPVGHRAAAAVRGYPSYNDAYRDISSYGRARDVTTRYAADDYSTPSHRRTNGLVDDSTSGWRPRSEYSPSPFAGMERGRATTPREAASVYAPRALPTQSSPPRPGLRPLAGSTPSALGRFTGGGTYTPRETSIDRVDSYLAPRRASLPSSTSLMPRTVRSGRSPSMLKDPYAAFLPAAHPSNSHRLCVALDLDETLVFARQGPLHVRPFTKDLLRALRDMDVEVIVWTAGERDYAQSAIRAIDPLGTIQHCVYRHPSWWTGQPGYAKDLRALGRNLSRTLLVDNTPDCLREQPDNGILISDFEGPHYYDECLRNLVHVVRAIAERPFDSVPAVLATSPDVVRRTVPMDMGGYITTWALACDEVLTRTSYQATRFNRDSPPRARSTGRW